MTDDTPKRKRKCREGLPLWMATYGDMVTLLLCFFVLLVNPPIEETQRLQLIMASLNNMGVLQGGNTLESGPLAELGNNVMSLPSVTPLRRLDKARQKAVNTFKTENRREQVIITQDQRGLIISLTGDFYFIGKTANLDIQEARPILRRLASLLSSPELSNRRFRIEGHTNNTPTDPNGPYPSNWELSIARSVRVLHHLVNLGVSEDNFEVAGFADKAPIPDRLLGFDKNGKMRTAPIEGRGTKAERVDIIILRTGHE
ncbi:OmpA family protein [Candidatus Haliotispira prima]|uniref:OmpA family protein n=1 Tax=Candidatus Haliotispira prima TaxID=3034016 RepID=A0ABY8MGE5_9SPIO|nr:OmpA family protein [Candidatus Haliotispira prima]